MDVDYEIEKIEAGIARLESMHRLQRTRITKYVKTAHLSDVVSDNASGVEDDHE